MNRTLIPSSFLYAFCIASALAGTPPYRITDILTADAPAASRSKEWKPGAGIPLEVSGMDWMPDGRLAVVTRKGEIWMLAGVLSGKPEEIAFQRFASGLHEPLGALSDGDSLLVAQRSEVTRLRDTDGDGIADEYRCAASGWNVSGAYHGYAYGPKRDGKGNLWVTLNLDMGEHSDNTAPWRGWGGILAPTGAFLPMAAGMRSPCGIGTGPDGEMFCVDQQGTWVPSTPIYHLRKGAFYLNPEGIAPAKLAGSPVRLSAKVPAKMPYPDAVKALPEMCPPAVWLPYNKMARSGTDLLWCDAGGKFGPFDRQMLVAEFTDAKVGRVFLEKIEGEYQGAAFPFLEGFASGIVRMLAAKDGSLLVGMTSRGWSSLGTKSYGLQRVQWNGDAVFAIREMRAKPDGFELVFTQPVDPATATDPASYEMTCYTYLYSSAYGSDEIQTAPLRVLSASLAPDGRSVRLRVEGLRPLFVHELHAPALRSAGGAKLDHADAYYTLNRIPRPEGSATH